ncbi:uncharacterized protein LOC9645595 [Selaginella moellendorffii]|uniref:uncharacterized protein LOC9645595 n=1 Tax=Selaginella moellendorffii TaxID=88036 RepID=UPI000D1C5C40|nr:uncharacterized protein LOC9645595 [Selaginella moellendorffii]|eukprot:XP_024536531.1 uncharacterized protein LOC9645595 [Selaginella moellendorffii]
MAEGEDDSASSSSGLGLSSSDSEQESKAPVESPAPAAIPKRKKASKKGDLSFADLAKHGYSSGPSVLNVPAPNRNANFESNWSWSGGKQKTDEERQAEEVENIDERERTREIVNTGAEKFAENTFNEYQFAKKQRRDAAAEQRAQTFSKKEKRKRDLGQASRGKSYVEEEKRLLRDRGVYSGFD